MLKNEVAPLNTTDIHIRRLLKITERYLGLYEKNYGSKFIFNFDGQIATIANSKIPRFVLPKTYQINFIGSSQVLKNIFSEGSIALGNAYCNGFIWGNQESIANFIEMLLDFVKQFPKYWRALGIIGMISLIRPVFKSEVDNDSTSNSNNVNFHYSMENFLNSLDTSNRFFHTWLGKYPVYSCGLWQNAQNLEQAQINKFELYAQLLGLEAGKKLLDLGCGWGAQSIYYVQKYGVDVTLVTLSKAQSRYIEQKIRELQIYDRVKILEIDMTSVDAIPDQFDYIYSLGAIEHLSNDQRKQVFSRSRMVLKQGGVALWHTMFNWRYQKFDAWLAKNMWPGVQIPTFNFMRENLKDIYGNVKDFIYPTGSYARTFEAWAKNFFTNRKELLELVQKSKHTNPEWVIRAFEWYLMSCQAVFESQMNVGYFLVRK